MNDLTNLHLNSDERTIHRGRAVGLITDFNAGTDSKRRASSYDQESMGMRSAAEVSRPRMINTGANSVLRKSFIQGKQQSLNMGGMRS